MGISNINGVSELSTIGSVKNSVKMAMAEESVAEKAVREDTFIKSSEDPKKEVKKEDTGIYSRESIIEQLKDAEEQRVKAFQETIKSMLAQQGENVNLTFRGMELHVTEEQRLAAEKSISEGGEYSVENVTDRIMSMAKALAGDDPTKIDMLQDAVIKGFKGAVGQLGRKSLEDMPDITQKTYDSVMKEFSNWKKSYETTDVDDAAATDNDNAA